jgi:hypothetical protein
MTPTPAQIEKDVALPTFTVEILPGTAWVDVSADVVEVSGDYRVSAGTGDGIGFGLAENPTQRIRIAPEAYDYDWDRVPVRISLGFEDDNALHFLGLIEARSESDPAGEWEAIGYQELIRTAGELRTPLYKRRPVFTATTASSIEDPEDVAYSAGLGNHILWHAGGRPLEQSGTYPDPLFYYSCQQAILAPEYTWLNGGDPASALDELCRVAGGVVYQDQAGVVRYVEPFQLATGATVLHYTDAEGAADEATRIADDLRQYGSIRRTARGRRTAPDVVRASFIERSAQTTQVVYQTDAPRVTDQEEPTIGPSDTAFVTVDLDRPCLEVSEARVVVGVLGTPDEADEADYTVLVTLLAAQRAVIAVENTGSDTLVLYRVELRGRPLVAADEVTVSYADTVLLPRYRELTIPDSVYLATRGHAERLTHLYWDLYHEVRPVVELGGCGFDPTLELNAGVLLTNARLGITAAEYRVIGIRAGRTGVSMDLTLAPTAGLPQDADFFILGTTYSGGDTRQLSY